MMPTRSPRRRRRNIYFAAHALTACSRDHALPTRHAKCHLPRGTDGDFIEFSHICIIEMACEDDTAEIR